MALLLRGRTLCPICGKVIGAEEEATLFPHFILNEKDPLYVLSDSACHSACVSRDTLGSLMAVAFEDYLGNTGPGKRICRVCTKEVSDPDDYLLMGYLADPSTDQLGIFNYTHLHKSHIAKWSQAEQFLTLAKATLDSNRWHGDRLAEMIRVIEEGLQ